MPWIDVLASDDVAPGTVVGIEVDDGRRVVWRTGSGELAGCDARCPHQCSDLAHQAVVDGDELVCLTHFWRFDTGGHGSKLSITGRRDLMGDVAAVAVRERNGRVEVAVADAPG